MREHVLPSGAVLKLNPAPFADAKALYQAILSEARGVTFTDQTAAASVIGTLFCTGFSSPLIEAAVTKCMTRCTIDDLKIDKDTFESVERRGDYMPCVTEVMKENVLPFASSLFAAYKEASAAVLASQPSKSMTIPSQSISDSVKPDTPPQ